MQGDEIVVPFLDHEGAEGKAESDVVECVRLRIVGRLEEGGGGDRDLGWGSHLRLRFGRVEKKSSGGKGVFERGRMDRGR